MSNHLSSIEAHYDAIPYVSRAFWQSSPARLEAIARLFGLETVAVANARILEIGCASGGNIIPLAARYPGTECVGIDLSGGQIAKGLETVRQAGLDNVSLRAMDVATLSEAAGRFDYIICHGVFSWVPPETQTAILDICARHLSDHGICYISYNTYPGWKAKEVLRDAMVLRSALTIDRAMHLPLGLGIVEFLAAHATPGGLVASVTNAQLPLLKGMESHYLTHEFLEDFNQPVYFADFLDAARRAGLEYLAETEISLMFASNYGAAAEPLLQEVGHSQAMMEQYFDFLTSRTFRQTLLVRPEQAARIVYKLDAARITALHFAGRFSRMGGGNGPGRSLTYAALFDRTVLATDAIGEAVMATLDAAFPATMEFGGLVQAVEAATGRGAAEVEAGVSDWLEYLLIKGHLWPSVAPVVCASPQDIREGRFRLVPGVNAEADCAFANIWHETVTLSDELRALVQRVPTGSAADEAGLMQLRKLGLLVPL